MGAGWGRVRGVVQAPLLDLPLILITAGPPLHKKNWLSLIPLTYCLTNAFDCRKDRLFILVKDSTPLMSIKDLIR